MQLFYAQATKLHGVTSQKTIMLLSCFFRGYIVDLFILKRA